MVVLIVVILLSFAVVIVLLTYLNRKKNDAMDSEQVSDNTVKYLLRDNHFQERLYFSKGYYVDHRFKMSKDEIKMIEISVQVARERQGDATEIMIDNGTRSIFLTKNDGNSDYKNGSKAFEFKPTYKDGELEDFTIKPALNFY